MQTFTWEKEQRPTVGWSSERTECKSRAEELVKNRNKKKNNFQITKTAEYLGN